jgi:CRISPR-associated protein Cas2
MYVIVVYDVASERTGKMLRLCRKYLHWVQNSVFEGEVTEVKLKELVLEAQKIMDIDYDSLLLFKNRSANWLDKEVIGVEKSGTDQFL